MNQQNHPSVEDIETALGLSVGKRRGRLQNRVIMGLVLAALAFGGNWLYVRSQSNAATVTYETVTAAKADVIVTVSASGTIQPITQVEIGSEASGVVRQVLVAENGLVKTGDVLAILDTTRLEAQRARTAAQLQAAEARLVDANATATERQLTENRQKSLRAKGLSTAQDMDTAAASSLRGDAGLTAAQADVTAAKADLNIIDADISKTRVLSPIDGVILKRSVEPGQTVAASLQAPVLFKIAQDLKRKQLWMKQTSAK
jgi:HlyD family secretion protein